ncbi:MAG: DUF814 domain-containing protein [Candidatus Micrarchaeota archaeon]|nr:DUF814 domain-containing protein [Candidatus Micrarchaeota archaeon]
MKIKIDYKKSAQENANDYYNKSKKLNQKKAGAEKAIKILEKRLAEHEAKPSEKKEKRVVKTTEKKWYEKFHWFYTSNNMLAIGGRDAHQNEQLNSKHFEEKDLFFHADIFGASAVILIDGTSSPADVREEVAQFAACYSRAWEEMLRSVDVYAMRRNQVSKSTSKGSLGTGSFLLTGEREWFRSMTLNLAMYVADGELRTVPMATFVKLGLKSAYATITQGNLKKSDAAKKVMQTLGYEDLDNVMRQLPNGTFKIEPHK